jgi:ATP synthase F1 delta subunit
MAELTVDKTYAKGLFLAAEEMSKTAEIMEEARELGEIFDKEMEFFEFIRSPIVSSNEKKQILRKVFEGRISKEMFNFILVLVDKGRVSHFPRIIRQYELLLYESQGFSRGIIYSALPLSEDQLRLFEQKTGEMINKEVRLDNRSDKSLIGGVRIFIEGRLIDASVKKRLDDLKETLIAGIQ